MADVGFFVGALIPTFLLSRLVLWLMRSWDGGVTRLALAHVFSWLIGAFIGGLGIADGGAFAGIQAAGMYALPQAVWFVVDMFRHKRASGSTVNPV